MKRRSSVPTILFTIGIALFTLIVMVPFLWMLLLSFKTDTEIVNAPLSLPAVFSFANYQRALQTLNLASMYKNTFLVVGSAQILTLLITFFSSFAISRLRFRKERTRNSLYLYFLAGLAIPNYVLLFPIYRINVLLGTHDSLLALIIPYTAISISFNSLMFIGFLNDFPGEIEEAATIDGCGLLQLMFRIVVPIIKPVIATVTVFNVIYNWNEFPFAVTYISSSRFFTISLGASMFKGRFSVDYSGIVAATVLILIPQLIFYTLLQRQVINGMTEGAIKG